VHRSAVAGSRLDHYPGTVRASDLGGGVGRTVVDDQHGPAFRERRQHRRERLRLIQAGQYNLEIHATIMAFGSAC